jgi:hypothetical protein
MEKGGKMYGLPISVFDRLNSSQTASIQLVVTCQIGKVGYVYNKSSDRQRAHNQIPDRKVISWQEVNSQISHCLKLSGTIDDQPTPGQRLPKCVAPPLSLRITTSRS